MTTKKSVPLLAAGLLFMLAGVASAHPGHGGSGFSAGIAHPFSGIDHILAMVAVGIWASQIGGKARWLLPVTFIGLMIGGGLLNMSGVYVPLVEQGIMASVVVLGLLIALAARLPVGAMMGIVGLFAIFHGYAHVAEMNSGATPAAYAAGFILATAILHAVGVGLGMAAKDFLPQRILRTAGVAIAACGLLLFLHVM